MPASMPNMSKKVKKKGARPLCAHLADAGEQSLAVLEEADVEDGERKLDVPEVARAVRQLPPAICHGYRLIEMGQMCALDGWMDGCCSHKSSRIANP